jgi:hypothetical protein
MRRNIIWMLVVLNALLLVALAGRWGADNEAFAQAAPRRATSSFVMLPGRVTGGGNSAVMYFLDTRNGILGAMAYDDSRQEIGTMAPIDLNRILSPETGQ